MGIDSKFNLFEKVKFPRSENSFIWNECDVLIVVFITESSSGYYKVNVRVPVKLCSKCMNNAEHSGFNLIFLFEKIHDSLSGYLGEKRKSATMSSKKSTKLFGNSKSEMKVM